METDQQQFSLCCAVTSTQIPSIRTICATSLLPLMLWLTLPAAVPAQDYTSTANNGTITTGAAIPNPDTTTDTDPTEINTLDGVTYKPVRIVRVMPDGLLVAFSPRGGGVGMAKLRFENLPADLRRRYKQDFQRATEVAQEQAKLAAQYWADYKDATNRIAIQLAKEEAEERAEAERIAKENAEAELRRLKEERKAIDAMATEGQGHGETNRPPHVKPAGPY